MKNFDEHITAIIDMLEYDMWIVQPDPHIDCVCKNFTTKQADKFCPRCFGTGNKVKLRKIKGVRQPMSVSASGMNVTVETGVYFFKNDYKIKEDDILIWGNEIEQVTKAERFCSDSQKPVYYRCETTPKKTNTKLFLKIFRRVISGRK